MHMSQQVAGILRSGEQIHIEIGGSTEEIVGVNLDKDKQTVIVGLGKARQSISVNSDIYRIDDSEGYSVIRKIEESITQEKTMTNKRINEGVLSEDEETGVIAKYTLYMLAKSATRLHKMVQDEEEVSQEVLDKLREALYSINEIKEEFEASMEVEEAFGMTRNPGTSQVPSAPRRVANIPHAAANVPADAAWEAKRAAKKAEPAERGFSALFADDNNDVTDIGNPYVVLHTRKGKLEVNANTSYEAAQKAAGIWKLRSTSGITAYAQDVIHTAESVDDSEISDKAHSMFESAKTKAKTKANK